jgi:Protein of unknown function (DUF4446)
MNLPIDTLSILVVVSLGLSLLLLIGLIAVARRARRKDPVDPIGLDPIIRGLFEDHRHSIQRLEHAVRVLNGTDKRQEGLINATVRHVGLLRYDAFEDVGGRLSFSCALLDDHGNGVVLTSINGRQDTRVYAKPIAQGESPYNLSGEEEEAIRQALDGSREAVRAT